MADNKPKANEAKTDTFTHNIVGEGKQQADQVVGVLNQFLTKADRVALRLMSDSYVVEAETLASVIASGITNPARASLYVARLKRNKGTNQADVRVRDYGDKRHRTRDVGGDGSGLATSMATMLPTGALTGEDRLWFAVAVAFARTANVDAFKAHR